MHTTWLGLWFHIEKWSLVKACRESACCYMNPQGMQRITFFKVRNFPQHTVSKRKLRSLKKKIIAVLKENSESDYSSSIMCETTPVHEPEMGAGGGESREGHSLSDPDSQKCQIEAGG